MALVLRERHRLGVSVAFGANKTSIGANALRRGTAAHAAWTHGVRAVSRPQARPQVLIDNDRVVVTKWSFSDGAETGWHRHGHDYVIVPLGDGKLLAEEPGGGTREAPLKDGVPYFREDR